MEIKKLLNNVFNFNTGNKFVIFGFFKLGFNITLTIFAAIYILCDLGMYIFLPIYLSTFGNLVGAYFSLWIIAFFLMIFFIIISIIGIIRKTIPLSMLELKWWFYPILMGLCNTIFGILFVYSAFLSRVSGPLQAILIQLIFFPTLILSKIFLKKTYNKLQYMGIIFVFIGILISLIPNFFNLNEAYVQSWFWLSIRMLASIPNSLGGIFQEKFQIKYIKQMEKNNNNLNDDNFINMELKINDQSKENISKSEIKNIIYSPYLLQAFQFFWHWISLTIFFWIDILPGFGSTKNIKSFWEIFSFNFKCFFGTSYAIDIYDKCSLSGLFGFCFIILFIIFTIINTYLTQYSTANFVSLISEIAPLLAVIFWFTFKSINIWAGGSHFTYLDIIFSIIALCVIIIGSSIFQYKDQSKNEINNKQNIYLCCGENDNEN